MKKANEILKEIIGHTGKTLGKIAGEIDKRPQVLYDIRNERVKSISLEIATSLNKIYPELDIQYMTTGNGELINKNASKGATDQDRFNAFVINELASIRAQIKGTLYTDELALLEASIEKALGV
ncbi:hypothetical protein SAMN05192529_11011 [Arachidicoccus rhizosphaerae]|uniref:Uncharacterized protein n=1 Tax=Arachidicoccus rhizosphaerae TaxID=551991 RepID=A0A1H3Z494_9BACT|nr:hypothetical protein [Arachidicoccus rhizosphaerae]SEA18535.1 hypothetical protein SAMN05192529_11011 [Arachidicoccus rhizosphaerae]